MTELLPAHVTRRGLNCTLLFLLLCPLLFPAVSAHAASALCLTAANAAAAKTGVPRDVMQRALSQDQTDQQLRFAVAHPWRVTIAGEPSRDFANNSAAQAYLFTRYLRGARHFSVGCFQVRYRTSQRAFATIEEMFVPEMNAIVAAGQLQELHVTYGNWPAAVAAYHADTFNLAQAPSRIRLAQADDVACARPAPLTSRGANS